MNRYIIHYPISLVIGLFLRSCFQLTGKKRSFRQDARQVVKSLFADQVGGKEYIPLLGMPADLQPLSPAGMEVTVAMGISALVPAIIVGL